MDQYTVLVGATGDNEGAGTNAYGPFTQQQADEFSAAVQRVFAEAKKRYGVKAYPYGEVFVDTLVLRNGYDNPFADKTLADASLLFYNAQRAGDNWVYDPDLADV